MLSQERRMTNGKLAGGWVKVLTLTKCEEKKKTKPEAHKGGGLRGWPVPQPEGESGEPPV